MAKAKLSETMIGVLRMARAEESLYGFCANRAEYGARTGSIYALRRRGFLVGDKITEAGREALERAMPQGRVSGSH